MPSQKMQPPRCRSQRRQHGSVKYAKRSRDVASVAMPRDGAELMIVADRYAAEGYAQRGAALLSDERHFDV